MKRSLWVRVGAVFFVAFLLLSCRGPAETGPRLGVVLKALDSEFWLSVKDGAEKAAEELQVEITVLAPPSENDVEKQITIIEDLISQKVSGLAVSATDMAAVVPPLERGVERNIPFVTLDSDARSEKKVAFIGTDNFRGGQLAGEYLVRRLGGKGQVALITGVPGQQAHVARRDGFLDVIEKARGINLVAAQPANSDRALAMKVMENILQAHPDLQAVFVTSAAMAMGAGRAVKSGKKEGQIVLVGFDTSREILLAIGRGEVSATIAQNPFQMGYLAVKELYRAVQGEEPTAKRIDTGTAVVTSENYKEYLPEEPAADQENSAR